MTTATLQVNRIVSIVSHLTRRERAGEREVPLKELARRFGVSETQISRDLAVLTMLGDDPECDWLSSLRVWQEGESIGISTFGPFQRPVRLLPNELLAIKVGLAVESDEHTGTLPELSPELAAELWPDGEATGEPPREFTVGRHVSGVSDLIDLTRSAITEQRCIALRYAGEGSTTDSVRTVQPHQLVYYGGRTYIVALCENAGEWRRFRADRAIDAVPTDRHFTWRDDFEPIDDPSQVFAEPEEVDEVQVRFSPRIARWMKERYPDAVENADGSVVVTYRVASVDWFVRHILQYGEEAEVVGDGWREAVTASLEKL